MNYDVIVEQLDRIITGLIVIRAEIKSQLEDTESQGVLETRNSKKVSEESETKKLSDTESEKDMFLAIKQIAKKYKSKELGSIPFIAGLNHYVESSYEQFKAHMKQTDTISKAYKALEKAGLVK